MEKTTDVSKAPMDGTVDPIGLRRRAEPAAVRPIGTDPSARCLAFRLRSCFLMSKRDGRVGRLIAEGDEPSCTPATQTVHTTVGSPCAPNRTHESKGDGETDHYRYRALTANGRED